MNISRIMRGLSCFINRNRYTIDGKKVVKNTVNLDYWQDSENIGDQLSPVIVNWMLAQRGIKSGERVAKTKHLLAVGSIFAKGTIPPDATVWGSGIHHFYRIVKTVRMEPFVKRDIRSVRGPVTAHILRYCGYKCPEVYGDPAVLMPMIYMPSKEKKYEVSLIRHFQSADLPVPSSIHRIDTRTSDYKLFIDEICASRMVISSSLHGIILAEAYGVPTVFLQENMDEELLKYYDWYYSTGRKQIRMAYSVEEALRFVPMPLPDLTKMRKDLLNSFPYDLWEK